MIRLRSFDQQVVRHNLVFILLLQCLASIYVENWLDPVIKTVIKTDYTTTINQILTSGATHVRMSLYMPSKQNLDWNRTERQTEGNKDHQNV